MCLTHCHIYESVTLREWTLLNFGFDKGTPLGILILNRYFLWCLRMGSIGRQNSEGHVSSNQYSMGDYNNSQFI